MQDTGHIVRKLGLEAAKVASVQGKATEFVRLATARLGHGGLGQGELCKGAACVELACQALGVQADAALLMRCGGTNEKVYRNAKAALQKVLGVVPKATARDLCIQFGCARHDQSVRACLAAYKERFVRSLSEVQRGHVDFSRAVFLAAAFYLVARKHKVAVDRVKLLGPLGVTATEFMQVCASMSDLCHDLVGTEPRKRKAEELPEEQRALIDRTGAADDGDEASCSEDEVLDEGMVGHRINAKKQKQREYAAWKEKQLKEGAEAKKKSKEKLTEKKLKQAVLSFAAGSSGGDGSGAGQQAGAAEAAATEAAAAPEQQQQQQQHVAGSGSDSGKDASLAKTVVGSKAGGSRPKGRTPAKAALAQNNS